MKTKKIISDLDLTPIYRCSPIWSCNANAEKILIEFSRFGVLILETTDFSFDLHELDLTYSLYRFRLRHFGSVHLFVMP